MVHSIRYAFKGQARLAADAGVSKSAVSRFLSGQCSPSLVFVLRIVKQLERHLGMQLDIRELVSLDGTYPTPSVCKLLQCHRHIPEDAYDDDGNRKPEYRNLKPGQWFPDVSSDGTSANAPHSKEVS